MKYIKGLLFIIIIVNFILSGFLMLNNAKGTTFCIFGSGCENVQKSIYGHIFGISVSLLGVLAFALIFIIYLLAYKKIIPCPLFLSATFIGTLIAIYFLYIQLFILKQICTNCFIIDTLTIIIFILALTVYFKDKKNNNSSFFSIINK